MTTNTFIIDTLISIISIFVISYPNIMFLNNINKNFIKFFNNQESKLDKIINISRIRSIKQFILDHNKFCQTLNDYNRFWSQIYLWVVLTMLPINLMLLHTVLFEPMPIISRLIIALLIIACSFVIFIIQFAIADISRQIHKTSVKLSQIQWRLNGWLFRTNNKIKLMAYFERLSSNKKIGISIGPTIVITIPVFAQVML